MATPVVMPQLGESVVEGIVVKWRVKEGDLVKRDQPLCEVETDKATSEVPSPIDGRVKKILVAEGATVGVGKPIVELEEASGQTATTAGAASAPSAKNSQPPPLPTRTGTGIGAGSEEARISPVVRKMASEHQIDLSRIQGTGDGGRVTKKDVQAFLDQGQTKPAAPRAPEPKVSAPVSPSQPAGSEQPIPFTRRRKLIADRMTLSRRTIPEVTCGTEVDVSKVAALRARYKAQQQPGAPKLTYLPFVAHAAVRALRDFPVVNAQVLEDAYVLKREINLGLAVDSAEGLTVPVIKRADELSLIGLARITEELGEKGRTGKLTADELSGGTFTLSNPGLKGNLWGTPIILHPQVGILRMGEVVKRPVVVEREGEDLIVVRPIMNLSFAYDHRIIDGVAGNGYLHRVKELLEAGDFPL